MARTSGYAGPVGPRGPAGPMGPQGPAGPAGPAWSPAVQVVYPPEVPHVGGWTRIGDIVLAAGTYWTWATAQAQGEVAYEVVLATGGTTTPGGCLVGAQGWPVDNTYGLASVTTPPGTVTGPVTVTLWGHTIYGGTVAIISQGDVGEYLTSISALQVGA